MSEPLDYFSPIDSLVSEALTEFAEVTDLVPTSMIQVWDRVNDVRGNLDEARFSGWIRIVPGPIKPVFDDSSSESRFEIPYAIEYGHAGLQRSKCNQIATAIIRGLLRLHLGLEADGETPITNPFPFRIESAHSIGIDRERIPIDDPEGWTDVNDVIVVAYAARADLLVTPK